MTKNETESCFRIEEEGSLPEILKNNSLSDGLLETLEHGSLLWSSEASVYFVILDKVTEDAGLPYRVQICRIAEEDDEQVVMASCALTGDLHVIAPQFQGGLETTPADFTRYLEMAMEDIDSSPRVIDECYDDEMDFDDE